MRWRSSAGSSPARSAGAVNGFLIAYVGLSPFVVTLGMLSVARSLAIVLSQNKMIYEFGPDGDTFNAIGGGDDPRASRTRSGCWSLLTLVFALRASTSRPGAAISTRSAATSRRPG